MEKHSPLRLSEWNFIQEDSRLIFHVNAFLFLMLPQQLLQEKSYASALQQAGAMGRKKINSTKINRMRKGDLLWHLNCFNDAGIPPCGDRVIVYNSFEMMTIK
jgi:hypothetical protein